MPSDAPNRNHAASRALFDELARSGVRHVCICPGSRSTPLTAAALRTRGLDCSSHIDERAAGFFALGLAKASRSPVALVCTSGTAAANFHPAAVEAHHAGVPLVILTADRPPELRSWGAAQTIDQTDLFRAAVRWFAEAPVPEPGDATLRSFRALACRAVAEANGEHAGPVHLNLPFREPLAPEIVPGDLGDAGSLALNGRDPAPYIRVHDDPRQPTLDDARAFAEQLGNTERGWIVCGPLDADAKEASAIANLARRLGWPLFAEATSQLRRGAVAEITSTVTHFDAFLRDAAVTDGLAPDCVLRFGATPTSKAFRLWLERARPAAVLHVEPAGAWRDASQLASDVLPFAPRAFCEAILPHLKEKESGAWLEAHVRAQARADAAVDAALADDDTLHGPCVVRELGTALGGDTSLYVANSLAVRDLDAYLRCDASPLRILSNRGANGIDGTIASAIGAAAADPQRNTVLLTGDVAFLHDASALLSAARNDIALTIVVLDDDGGAIFAGLPIAAYGESVGYDTHFRTRHGADLGAIAAAYGAQSVDITSREHLRTELKQIGVAGGVRLLRVPIDPEVARERRSTLARLAAEAARATGSQNLTR